MNRESEGERIGIPHLAKNERDMGPTRPWLGNQRHKWSSQADTDARALQRLSFSAACKLPWAVGKTLAREEGDILTLRSHEFQPGRPYAR